VKFVFRAGLVIFGAVSVAACSASGGSGTPPTAPAGASLAVSGTGSSTFELPPNLRRACRISSDPELMHCLALVHTDREGGASPAISGHTPSDIQSAYNLPSSTAGTGQTIAIVDAFDDPNAESDLATYRSNFGLPACGSTDGCFQKLNEKGKTSPLPAPNSGWAVEESLDVDMISAVCPNCHIVLIEATTNSSKNLGKSVDEAAKLKANAISNSYIGYGAKGTGTAAYYNHPGIIITAGGGDGGYGIGEPAGLPTVVSVGGTELTPSSSNPRGWNEVTWPGTGSGCEKKLQKPSWQTDTGCKGRTMNDVAAVATNMAMYDTYQEGGWIEVDGTSIATPVIAGVYGLGGNEQSLNAAQSLYAKNASLFDITSGSNGTCSPSYLCTAGPGYDGPTGNGTPNGVSAF
jgi:hypothetical protein